MAVPKHDTIVKYCDNNTAVQILRDRGMITEEEATTINARIRESADIFYGRIYNGCRCEWDKVNVQRLDYWDDCPVHTLVAP